MKNKKIRKIALIFYGYGIRQIVELDKVDIKGNYPSPEEGNSFELKGIIDKIVYIDRKHLKKLNKKW